MKQNLCETLLQNWCEKLLTLQITDSTEDGLYGGILCPACAGIHGRCFEAIYPFLYLADTHQDQRFLDAAKLLFDWAERVVSRPDGSYVNDPNSDWQGTTVFSVIQLAEALHYHGHILDAETRSKWMNRLAAAAKFISSFPALNSNNINYRITNALAMQYCSQLLNMPEYAVLAKRNADAALHYFSKDGFLFGEGVPSDGQTPRGCRPVDIGYNVEESLPSLASYARMIGNRELELVVADIMSAQLRTLLPDGGWDNSFGTRNFKWTYWGSRTSDGSALGYLLMAEHNPDFAGAALSNLQLLQRCTHNGLLHGGPHYHNIGERPCIHHTFTHAKTLAGILDHGLSLPDATCPPPHTRPDGVRHFPDIDSYFINCNGLLATITASDWEYLPGGHASGGNLSLLWHPATGPVLCATMSQYQMKEPNNMQLPRFPHHECLSPALEYIENDCRYTTLYDFESAMSHAGGDTVYLLQSEGQLLDIRHKAPELPIHHRSQYRFSSHSFSCRIELDRSDAAYICPIISAGGEPVSFDGHTLTIEKKEAILTLTAEQGTVELPYGTERCYNLVAGFQAVKAVIRPESRHIAFTLNITERSLS